MNLRIHHFFDIIRDYGSGKLIIPHPYGHSFHIVACELNNNPLVGLQLVKKCDAICFNCNMMENGNCLDTISHRTDFLYKEAFNNHIDTRIMDVCNFTEERLYTPMELCSLVPKFVKNASYIYEGNNPQHTRKRCEHVLNGYAYYLKKHK